MTILVDAARWEWNGQRWAHMVSDRDLEELHGFARRVGLRYLSFGLDHYDVGEAALPGAVAAGAESVSSRELARRLVASGLRRRVGHGARRWRMAAGGSGPVDRDVLVAVAPRSVTGRLDPVAAAVEGALATEPGGRWRVLHRPGELVAMVQWDPDDLDSSRHDAVAAVGSDLAGDAVDHVVSARDPRAATVELVVVAEVSR